MLQSLCWRGLALETGNLFSGKVVDKLCALVCWDNLINWLNSESF